MWALRCVFCFVNAKINWTNIPIYTSLLNLVNIKSFELFWLSSVDDIARFLCLANIFYSLKSEMKFCCQVEVFSWVSPWQCLPERDAESATPLSLSSSLSLLFALLFFFTVSEGPSQGIPPKRDKEIIFHQMWFILYVITISATRCLYNSSKSHAWLSCSRECQKYSQA